MKDKNSKEPFDPVRLFTKSQNDIATANSFPYTKEVCRCRFCRYCKRGKCSLRTCCCMPDRIAAHTCSFSEILYHCFADVQNSAFRFRLKLAVDHARKQHSCFANAGHRKRFYKSLRYCGKKDRVLLAQLYLLTAKKELWERAQKAFFSDGVSYSEIKKSGIFETEYNLLSVASDLEYHLCRIGIEDLVTDEIVNFESFCLICYGICIAVYGEDVVVIADQTQKGNERSKRT